jgi:hypothetical protein
MLKQKMVIGAIAIAGMSAALMLRAQTAPACELCGTWILLDRIDRASNGQVVAEPSLGSDPRGIVVYDKAGNVSAQLMKRNRTENDVPEPSQAPQGANNSAATNGYDAYFGKYVVDSKAHTVRHQLDGAIAARDVGKSFIRNFEFVGDELHLSFDTTNNGVPVRRTLRWRRAA